MNRQETSKQTQVCGTIYWLLLRKAKNAPTKKTVADLKMAIKCARAVLRDKLDDQTFNLRHEFVVNSLSRDPRFVLPPTCGKGFTEVYLAKSLKSLIPAELQFPGRSLTYFEILDMLFAIEDKKVSAETKKEIEEFALAA